MNPPQLLQGGEVFRILVTNALYINNRDRNYLIVGVRPKTGMIRQG
jgi:hypothetical protein